MTQGGRSQKSSILYLDFSSFALSCLISEVNTEIAESPVMIRLSAIPPYPPVSCKLFELGGGIQNLGAGGIHFRRVCEVLTVFIKITTPKGLVIFMQITVKTDISAKSKNAAERRSQITTQRSGCDLGRRSSKINAL